jgi:hypothetical protein
MFAEPAPTIKLAFCNISSQVRYRPSFDTCSGSCAGRAIWAFPQLGGDIRITQYVVLFVGHDGYAPSADLQPEHERGHGVAGFMVGRAFVLSHAAYRDDNPQSGGSSGKVYDVDSPGKTGLPVDNNTYRYRGNFYAYAALPDGTRISPFYNYYVRVSCKRTTSGYQFANDFTGDNTIGAETTLNTWNLQ